MRGGFRGTYCHYDGYPAHQGRVLFDAVTGHFASDTDAACSYLIDQHPAGWSVLHGDFNAPPGYRHREDPDDLRNQCTARTRPGRPLTITPPTTPGSTTPTPSHPTGCRSSPTGGSLAAGCRAGLDHTPDWEAIDTHANHLRRQH